MPVRRALAAFWAWWQARVGTDPLLGAVEHTVLEAFLAFWEAHHDLYAGPG